ncbi:MAG: PAS domain S-box protein [Proteobacteria bacterium]|nr:PAS domain S-box protein [Pseudomonadota bacterium]
MSAERDSRLALVLDSIAEGYFTVDSDWRIDALNKAAAAFLGKDRDELLGQPLLQAMPQICGTHVENTLLRATAGESVCYEAPSVTHPEQTVRVRAFPFPDGGIAVAFTDITTERAAQEAARESEARFRLIADSAPVPMWVTSIDRKRVFVNRAYVDFMGLSYEEALDQDWRRFVHPDDQPRILKEQLEKEASLRPFVLEARYRRGDGSWRWMESHSQPRWDANGEHAGFIGVAFDISTAKEAETSLQRQVAERTAELEALYNRTPTILHSADADQRLISVSDRWLEFMGYDSRAEVLGRPLTDFLVPEDAERYRGERWPALIAQGGYDDFEYQVIKKSGEIAETLASARVWHDGQGRFARTMAALIDVTGRKRTEEALRQAQKVEAMGQLTGGVAHDFNNLLAPIIGGLDMLQRRGVGDDRTRRTIASALQAAERAKSLVQRLLAFARRQPLRPQPVDAGRLVEGLTELIAATIGPRVRLELDVADDLPACLADPNQVEMALLNLSVNARDAMPDGGTLTIRLSAENAPGDPDLSAGCYVRLCVADTGTGMSADVLARAVEPFFSTKGIGQGTGLGLSMVHGLAGQLGGALRIESKPGEGTQVALWLPCVMQQAATDGGSGAPQPVAAVGRVLLVDDEELVRRSTAEMLEEMGFDVVEKGSATEAAAGLDADSAFDLLVTDYLMPGMTGLELAAAMRSRRPDIPVLIVSGYAATADDSFARLAKPFRHADLAAAIATLTA